MSRCSLVVFGFALAAAATAATAGSASAQPQGYAPPPPPPGYGSPPQTAPPLVRHGFTVGGGLGLGSLQMEYDGGATDDFESVFFELHLGGMINPRLALLVELWGSSYHDEFDDYTVTQGNSGVALQYWVTRRLWLKGAVGSSRLTVRSFGASDSIKGGAFLAAAGYELWTRTNYALDLQLRMTFAGYDDTFGTLSTSAGAAMLGFSWY